MVHLASDNRGKRIRELRTSWVPPEDVQTALLYRQPSLSSRTAPRCSGSDVRLWNRCLPACALVFRSGTLHARIIAMRVSFEPGEAGTSLIGTGDLMWLVGTCSCHGGELPFAASALARIIDDADRGEAIARSGTREDEPRRARNPSHRDDRSPAACT